MHRMVRRGAWIALLLTAPLILTACDEEQAQGDGDGGDGAATEGSAAPVSE